MIFVRTCTSYSPETAMWKIENARRSSFPYRDLREIGEDLTPGGEWIPFYAETGTSELKE